MYKFGKKSLAAIAELHPLLAAVCHEAIKTVDFTVLDARRGKIEQERAYRAGNSQARFGESAHNYSPAIAFDIVPYPLSWDENKYKPLAKAILAAAKKLNVPLRWGADWDMDDKWSDEKFLDWGHFELHPWRTYAKKSKLYKG
ncbi:MAG: hypothetical protein EKK63_10055 [Acinetobacter sp.]|uniref:M15 family metallopeptidase n=1 Tax=Acinetobacter sp. TaxID=472 RepID=UPI000FADF21A|nr:M15 family metallopeptidase [Acinetobacter sp.]RUP39333.1 MAG: hypothetical protein EKK63_10055 [Acinetobacter sp.]